LAANNSGWSRRPIQSKTPRSDARARPDSTPTTPNTPMAPAAPAVPPPPQSAAKAAVRSTTRPRPARIETDGAEGRCDLHDLPWHLLRLEHTAALRTRLCATLAPATANKHMAALRGVLKSCRQQGRLTDDEYRHLVDLPPIRGESPRRNAALQAADFDRIVRICTADDGPAGARDEALLRLLRGSSLRRAEAVALDLADYDAREGTLAVRGANRGEGRRITVPAPARKALERWIRIRGDEAGPLFNPVNKGRRIERRRLSEQAIYIACQKRAGEAGLPPTSPEDLRRIHAEA
jgi:integrase